MPLKLQTIIASTRPGRIGPAVGKWFHGVAEAQGLFECSLVDLADFALPVYDEAQHPSRQNYAHEHTKAWSRSVAAADAYVFVTPEYNYSPPPSLVNALDYLYVEWNYKPCAFVSYGGVSGGLRSAQAARLMASTLKMMPLPEGVMIQMPWQQLDEDKQFKAGPPHEASAMTLLPELAKWAQALKAMR